MNSELFIKYACALPPHIAVLQVGHTGIGKSALGVQIADFFNMPMIDVRGAAMDEGKVSGIPDFETSKELGVSTFVLPSWYVAACKNPVLLHLDEMNRAILPVRQCFFQVVLDRCLSNNADGMPMKLHPETRILCSINQGSSYQVEAMGPALLRRFWKVCLEPDLGSWSRWAAKNRVDPLGIDFLLDNPEHFWQDPGLCGDDAVVPNPASWTRLLESLAYMNKPLSSLVGTNSVELFDIASGFVGEEAAGRLKMYVQAYDREVSVDQLLSGQATRSNLEKMSAPEQSSLIEKVILHGQSNRWSIADVKSIKKALSYLPDEMTFFFYREVEGYDGQHANKGKVSSVFGLEIREICSKARNLSSSL